MNYVDGYVLPVPTKNLAAYRRMARIAGAVWREHGALEYRECVADDVQPGKSTSFPQSVKLKPDEVVVFAWIVYKSRAHRDRVNAKVMQDPAPESHDGPENHALRRQAHVLGRFQNDGRTLREAGYAENQLACSRRMTTKHIFYDQHVYWSIA